MEILQTHTGYDLHQSDQVAKDALTTAFELVKKSRRSGAETRLWAAELFSKIRKLLWVSQQKAILKQRQDPDQINKKIGEITCWETDIFQILRSYMTTSSEILTRLKALNPPLDSSQIKPFLEAVEMDRKGTMVALEPLAKKMHELALIKAELETHQP